MPEISFVVPYFNKLKSLKNCLDSLFDQSVKDIEVVVVKDGPDLDADKILKKFEKKHRGKFKAIEIPHGGACKARNAGKAEATGKYICFWDADSYIEPGAAAVWLKAFELYPDVDFVYAGYRFLTEGWPGVNSEPFDVRQLQTSNYISGHFPIKREKCPTWDESLKSLQDWDFWLQAVAAGSKGHRLEGYAFKTDAPDKDSISGVGCTDENWLPRRDAVKTKHRLPDRDTCVVALENVGLGKNIAKILDADFSNFLTTRPHRYKTIVQVGWDIQKADQCAVSFNGFKSDARKVLFWSGDDIQRMLHLASFSAVEALAFQINRAVHYQFCEDKVTADYLRRLGFKAVAFPLPTDLSDFEATPLPEKFKVLVDVATEFGPFFDGIARAMPDVEFKKFEGALAAEDYTVLVQFLNDKSLSEPLKRMLLNGRYVLSNVQSPYCGYVSDFQPLESLRRELVAKLRALEQQKDLNDEAQAHYIDVCSPDRFRSIFKEIVHKEAVPA